MDKNSHIQLKLSIQAILPSVWRALPSGWQALPSSWRALPSGWRAEPSVWWALPSGWQVEPSIWRGVHLELFTQKNDLGRVVSRILSARVAPRRGSFICCDLTRSPDRFRSRDGPSHGPLFGLAPNGVYRAASLALGAVGSYPTFSPLPRPKPWRFVFCSTFRQSSSRINCPRVSSAEPRLHGIVSCGVRTFLPRRFNAESDPPPFQGGTDYRRKRARAQASSSVMSRV